MKRKYNWIEVQNFYDNGHTILETAAKFGMTKQNLSNSKFFKSRPKLEQKKMASATRVKKGNAGHSELTKQHLSKLAIDREFGGKNYRKTFNHNGIILESSYELAVAIELDNNNINWIRPKRMPWIDPIGKRRHYTPDFYLPDYDIYLDPKNDYLIKKDLNKIILCSSQNNVKIYMLSKLELTWEHIKIKAGLV
jgi:hypothetical protein